MAKNVNHTALLTQSLAQPARQREGPAAASRCLTHRLLLHPLPLATSHCVWPAPLLLLPPPLGPPLLLLLPLLVPPLLLLLRHARPAALGGWPAGLLPQALPALPLHLRPSGLWGLAALAGYRQACWWVGGSKAALDATLQIGHPCSTLLGSTCVCTAAGNRAHSPQGRGVAAPQQRDCQQAGKALQLRRRRWLMRAWRRRRRWLCWRRGNWRRIG